MASGRRPEHQAPPEFFYGVDEAQKYTSNSRIIDIQLQMSERALQLLNLAEDKTAYLLDIGCGSGLSGQTLSDAGHVWVGVDISSAMLDVAVEREVEGDLILGDMGNGLPFRPGSFDGAISISALQWLCNADKSYHKPAKRMYKFFSNLYACLSRGSRAVFQFYPENSAQAELVTQQAMRAGFTGGLVIDFPNSAKAKKVFLCLFTGGVAQQMPKGLSDELEERTQAAFGNKKDLAVRRRPRKGVNPKRSKDWILEKKERWRRQGKEVRENSKFTGRKRKNRF